VQGTQPESTLMNYNHYIVASLTITSSTMPLETLVELLPFTPSKCWRIGDTVGNSAIRRKHSGVVFSVPRQKVNDVETVVRELLDTLEPFNKEIKSVIKNESLDCEITCVVYSDQPPSCNLSADTIKQMAEMGVAFDLDLIISE
jgi:Domain of unknown function (DUF4279)